jgi:hypothetical protein
MNANSSAEAMKVIGWAFEEEGLKFADPWGLGRDAVPGDPCGGRAVCPGDPCGARAVCSGDGVGIFRTTSEFFAHTLGEIPSSRLSVEKLIGARLTALRKA